MNFKSDEQETHGITQLVNGTSGNQRADHRRRILKSHTGMANNNLRGPFMAGTNFTGRSLVCLNRFPSIFSLNNTSSHAA